MSSNKTDMHDFTESPPSIYHYGKRPKGYQEMIKEAAYKLSLSNGEKELLLYYARQRSGFSPAAATICAKTGMSENTVYRARKGLRKRGLIYYGREQVSLVIYWHRIRLWAAKEYKLTKEQSLNGRYAKPLPDNCHCRIGSLIHNNSWFNPNYKRKLTEEERKFADFLAGLTVIEYEKLTEVFQKTTNIKTKARRGWYVDDELAQEIAA